MQALPRTPSEIGELHGYDPISVGGAGEFSQVWNRSTGAAGVSTIATVNKQLEASMSGGLLDKRFYCYIFVRDIDNTKDAWLTAEYQLFSGSTLAATFPLSKTIFNAFATVPPDNQLQYVEMGCNSQTITPSENVICVRWATPLLGEPVATMVSPIRMKSPVTALKLRVTSNFNCDFRAWVGALSTS